MLWSSNVWANYTPSYCYGHDEPTVSYTSSAPGSGADARFRMVLPADGATLAQGDFYATIWFGGTVYDTRSLDTQAFLEFQFYPAAPSSTTGSSDCFSDGSFAPSFSLGSNDWFACAIVWEIVGGNEQAAFGGPLNVGATTSILEMHSGDTIYVNYSGVAQSTTQGWGISVADTTLGSSGFVTLVNGGLVLSPYYATAAPGNTLRWGASNPGAIAFAYEIGHGLDPAVPSDNGYGGCSPGETNCFSYAPGGWGTAGQMDLELPVVGAPGSQTYPTHVVFSSSQGGENEVNSTTCRSPNPSNATNCMYPWYQYRSGFYGFTFGAYPERNATHQYGGEYQFPATTNSAGQWNGNIELAPWGTFATTVSPLSATVDFNRAGATDRLSVGANGTAEGQFEEGPYWLNVSAPGCTSISTFVYVSTGSSHDIPAQLSCGGNPPLTATASPTSASGVAPLNVSFSGSATGGAGGYTYGWTFGDTGTSSLRNPYHVYSSAGKFVAVLTVTDSNRDTAASSSNITVVGPLAASASSNVTSGPVLLAVQFYGSVSGGVPGYSYYWTFGDGGISSAKNPTHVYSSVGTFTARFNVTDSASDRASSSVVIHTSLPGTYRVEFNETGLASATNWSVSVQGNRTSTTGTTIAFSLENGSHPYTVNVTNSSFRPLTANGVVVVSAASVTVAVPFERVNFTVTFEETTLPSGLPWSVHLGGATNSTTGRNLTFRATNGTHSYGVSAPSGYVANPSSGQASVAGANVNVTVGFAPEKFAVSFRASGFPSGINWSVTFNGVRQSSTVGWNNFSASDGSYPYSVTLPPIYSVNPRSGTVTVNLANQTVPLVFAPVLYAVTFGESGLPNGTSWSVLLNGAYHNVTTSSFQVELTNGSYAYSTTAGSGYTVTNGSGSVKVTGGPAVVDLRFTAVAGASSALGFLTSATFLLALAAIAFIVVGTVIYLVGARRRRQGK